MAVKTAYFLALLFAALALGPAMAHLLELPNKIQLPRDEYLVVQQIYRGWAVLGVVVFGALFSTLALTIAVRKRCRAFLFALSAFACIVGTQVIFWTFTYPANTATEKWTMLPAHWTDLRLQWEYAHAASALLNLMAVVALILSLLAKDSLPAQPSPRSA